MDRRFLVWLRQWVGRIIWMEAEGSQTLSQENMAYAFSWCTYILLNQMSP